MFKSLVLASHLFMNNDKIKVDSSILALPIDDFTISSGNANNASIWNFGVVPSTSKSVLISDGHTVNNGTVLEVKNLSLGVGSTLVLGVGQTLKIGF
jgi:hypothetical protein